MTHPDGMQAEIEKALQGMGMCNVLIAGRTGVGKSTLINSMFHGRMAATGDGRPVTRAARFISKEGVPLGVRDTRGLEMADFQETLDELTQLVERRASNPDPGHHIHVAWLCVHPSRTRSVIACSRRARPRVYRRIGSVMRWSIARGYRPDDPCTAVSAALPRNF